MEKKRKAKLITTLSLTVIVLAIMTIMPAMAGTYTIDGDLSDWGITDSDIQKGLNDTAKDPLQIGDNASWIPSVTTVQWVVEDNVDPDTIGYAHGVHIKGTGGTYGPYNEPLATHFGSPPYTVYQPFGGEPYDVEALYIDEDDDYVYFGIVASKINTSTMDGSMADLALNVDGDPNTGEYGCEYGVDLSTKKVWQVTDWKDSVYLLNVPTFINTGTYTGKDVVMATRIVVDSGGSDVLEENYGGYVTNNYIIEVKIPKSAIGIASGNPSGLTLGRIHYSCPCGNDPTGIPEFLAIAIPVGMLLGLIYVHRRKRQGKGREE